MSWLGQFIGVVFHVDRFRSVSGCCASTLRARLLVVIVHTTHAHFLVVEILNRFTNANNFFQQKLVFTDLIRAFLSHFTGVVNKSTNLSIQRSLVNIRSRCMLGVSTVS